MVLNTSKQWLFIIVIFFLLGITFRIINLENKIYWVDEVATSVRISGFTKQQIIDEVNNQELIPLKNLLNYQHNNNTFTNTWNALTKSPEQAPLYFIIAKIWTNIWGSSIIKLRVLSVIFSLLALPCVYWLCQELFDSAKVGLFASSFLAISPLYVTYAQEARPYSFWLISLLLSQIFLIRSLKKNYLLNWLLYGFFIITSIYTSLLSFPIIIAQIIYVLIIKKDKLLRQLTVVLISLIAFIPWLLILRENWQLFQDNTIWMKSSLDLGTMIIIWIYSISTVFIESPIYPYLHPVTILRIIIDVNLFILIIISLYFVCKKTDKKVWLFILVQLIIPLFIIRCLDLIWGGQRSTAIRYMMPSYLFIHISIAYLFAQKISGWTKNKTENIWKIILGILLFIQLSSCIFMLDKSPQYQKTRNLYNPVIAEIINDSSNPIILTEPDNILDAISLSYLVTNNALFHLIKEQEQFMTLPKEKTVFLLKPSLGLQKKITQQKFSLTQVYKPRLLSDSEIYLSLWKLKS